MAPGHELAMAYGNVSQRRMVVEDVAEALTWGGRALDLARELDDAEATVYALINIGAAELEAGADGGRAKLEDALALARHHGLEEYAGRAFLLLVYCSLRRRQLAVAGSYVEPALQYCADRDLGTWRLYLLACRARLELELGRWDQAGDLATAVLRDRRSAPVPRIWALTVIGLLRARRGDPEASAPLLEAHELVAGTGEIDRLGSVAAARAEHAWLRGATADVKLVTDSALSLARRRDSGWVLAELTYWRWRAGVRDEPLADQTPYRLSVAGDCAGAAALWRESGHRYETALALADSDDEQEVREALDLLRALGARPAISIVTRRLRERGVRGIPRGPRPRTRQNPAGLTPRELEVLTHLSDGMRNAQIASCLFVSEKTVDHHVSAVLRKLGVQTRGEASAEALRLGLTSPR
jgi:DNA-binding CsgD family transcriptional regulator